jgi:acyl-CoA thioesterase I
MSEKSSLPPETSFQIDFNLHWVPAALGLDIPPSAAAAIFGISDAEYHAYAAAVEWQVKQTAAELLALPAVAAAVDRLPVPVGGTLLAVGDSITTYRFSYAEVLASMLTQRREQDRIMFINRAQSGYTSTHGLEHTYTQFLTTQPNLVLIKYGVNDNKRFGSVSTADTADGAPKLLVSAEEYRANMYGIVRAFKDYTAALPVLLTPSPVVESIVNSSPDFTAMHMRWDNRDLQTSADAVRDLADEFGVPWVDLMNLFGSGPDPTLYLPDGLHPAPAGHILILQRLLETLTAWLDAQP